MLRVPPALWLLGLAVGVSLLTREPAPRARPAAFQVSRGARAPAAPKLALQAGAPAGATAAPEATPSADATPADAAR